MLILSRTMWSHGTPEKFIIHVQQTITALKVKGLQENYKKIVWVKKECMEKLKKAVLNHDLVEGEVRDDCPIAKAVQTATEAQAKGEECGRAHRQPDLSALLQLFRKRQGSPGARSWPSRSTPFHGRT